ncbi:origin recognition complex subunit 5 C-terminus-domain-containing protein, partial [Lipomyces oligophaga]|uniref:origin recognition complex subunit 5 C-terminus-domain-containing protein n=1 Tax=Lipomyces oligophaga TaxID=45792 RepID=UPI0034CE55B8
MAPQHQAMEMTTDCILKLTKLCPARYHQFNLLNLLLSEDPMTNPPIISLNGQPATGKTAVLRQFLQNTKYSHTWISVDECTSVRTLLQRITASLRSQWLNRDNDLKQGLKGLDYSIPCITFSSFVEQINDLLDVCPLQQAHFIVLDRIDQLGENMEAFYQFISDIAEMLNRPVLTFILVSNATNEPRKVRTSVFPQIYFPAYTKPEMVAVLSVESLKNISILFDQACTFQSSRSSSSHAISDEQLLSLWASFVSIVVNTFFSLCGSDVLQMKSIAYRIFPVYARPVASGEINAQLGSTAWYKLYSTNKHLLASEDLIGNSVTTKSTTYTASNRKINMKSDYQDMPKLSKYLLCAAYLASYNNPKFDVQLFSRIRERRKRRPRSVAPEKATKRHLSLSVFEYERFLAIFKCIAPENITSNIDIQTQIATLSAMRLISRHKTSSTTTDALDSKARWSVDVGWNTVLEISREINLPLDQFFKA